MDHRLQYNRVPLIVSKSPKYSTWVRSQKQQNDLCSFPSKPYNITEIQVYAPTTNIEEAEVEWFCEDLQNLLELTPPKDVLFVTGDWNTKVGSQETWKQASLALEYKMKQGKGSQSFAKRTLWSQQTPSFNNTRATLHMDTTSQSISKSD